TVATQRAQATTTAVTSAQLERPTTPKLPALDAQACDDAALNAAAASNDKPARSWAKHMQRRTHTSYRLTLELSGGEAVRLERDVRQLSLDDWGFPAIVVAMLTQGESGEIAPEVSECGRCWYNFFGGESEPVRASCSVLDFDLEPLLGKDTRNTLRRLLGRSVEIEIDWMRLREVGAGEAQLLYDGIVVCWRSGGLLAKGTKSRCSQQQRKHDDCNDFHF